MAQGRTLYLHALLDEKDLQKVIMNSIQYLCDSLTTTITHTLRVLLNDTLTAKNLSLFLDLNLFIKPNAFGVLLKTTLLSFREWKNFATIAINNCKPKLDTAQNKSKELGTDLLL
jgi:hypothetical protein